MGTEMEKRKMAETIWLQYFNERLFEQGVIDEKARNTMCRKIAEEYRKGRRAYYILINYANEYAYGMPDNAQRFSQGR